MRKHKIIRQLKKRGFNIKKIPYDNSHYGFDENNLFFFAKEELGTWGSWDVCDSTGAYGSFMRYGYRAYSTNKDGNIIALRLDYIPFSSYSYELPELKHLEFLGLSHVGDIDTFIFSKLNHIKKIDLSGCNLNDISFLKDFKELTELDIGANKISDISVFKNLVNLKRLGFGSDKITDVSVLKNLKDLEFLSIRGGLNADISVLKHLPKLKILILMNNNIKTIPFLKQFEYFKGLHLGMDEMDVLAPEYKTSVFDENGNLIDYITPKKSNEYRKNATSIILDGKETTW